MHLKPLPGKKFNEGIKVQGGDKTYLLIIIILRNLPAQIGVHREKYLKVILYQA